MLRHVVLLELEPSVTSEQLSVIVDALRALPDQVDVIDRYEVGVDAAVADGNATLAVTGDFADTVAWQAYQDDPAHQQVITDLIRPVLTRRTAIQYRI